MSMSIDINHLNANWFAGVYHIDVLYFVSLTLSSMSDSVLQIL